MTDILPTLKNTSRKPYIYKVTNLETGQYYIGSQCRGKIIGVNYFTSSTNKEFWEDFKTYGEEKYEIIIVKAFGDPKECVRAENYIIRNHMQLKDGLCLNRFYCCGNEKIFSAVGIHHSEKTKEKISRALKGIPHSEEAKKKMSRAKKGHQGWNKGVPWSEETKEKMSRAKKGIPRSEEAKEKISRALKGISRSEETKQKMSRASNRIKISIEGNTFESIIEASKYYNVDRATIRYWFKKNQHNAFYVEK